MTVRYRFVTRDGSPAWPEFKKEMAKIKKEITRARIELPKKTMTLAEQAGRFMAQRVRLMTKRKGATGNLALALEESVRFRRSAKNNFTITVGNTSLLPDYWAMINYGGHISPKSVPGFWDDGKKGAKKGEFVYTPFQGKEAGFMHPVNPIKGFHYIAYAHVRMLSYVRRRFNIIKSR